MKTKLLTFAFFVSVFAAFADGDKYREMMAKSIDQVYNSKSNDELLQAINTFDRIGNAEKSKWEPFYYESFGYIMLANNESDGAKKDAFLDQAKAALDKAAAIKPNESEIVAMEGFISMIRTSVDPATRGPKYSALAMMSFQKAIDLNSENPRALALLGRMQLGVAQFFKSEPTDACATAKKALEKFSTFKPENQFSPMWGKSLAEEVVMNCK